MNSKLKEEFLKLLEEDKEFRFAVAGYLGYSEVLKRLEEHDKKFNEILEELKVHKQKLEEYDKKFNDILNEIKLIWQKLDEHSKILNEHSKILNEHPKILNGHSKILDMICKTLDQINKIIQKFTYSIEDEAIDVISWKLKEKFNIEIKLSRLIIYEHGEEKLEINVYGVSNDLCIIGDVTLDLRLGKIFELINKVNELKKNYQQYLRKKILKTIYCIRYIPQAIEEAKKYNIWILTWKEELTKPIIEEV